MSRRLSRSEMLIGGYKFFRYLAIGGLFFINLEVTKRCNAHCNFCDYWKEKPPKELKDYTPVVAKLKPLSVGITGGEPLLREDLPDLIASLRRNFGFLHISLITNGSLLTREKGLDLWRAGLDELAISLDYLDGRHDEGRGLPGLTEHILAVAPELAAAGVDLSFNLVMKSGNYREAPQIVRECARMGIKVSISTYNCWRTNNSGHMIEKDELRDLADVIAELKELKRTLGNPANSHFYLDRVPDFFENRNISGCTAGLNWIQVTPDGMIKRCSDHPVAARFSEWRRRFFAPTDCGRCWYGCRGGAQEPWSIKRFVEKSKDALSA
ncbi:MAG: radical SAM protein [Syntrophobacteraceae bacterium]